MSDSDDAPKRARPLLDWAALLTISVGLLHFSAWAYWGRFLKHFGLGIQFVDLTPATILTADIPLVIGLVFALFWSYTTFPSRHGDWWLLQVLGVGLTAGAFAGFLFLLNRFSIPWPTFVGILVLTFVVLGVVSLAVCILALVLSFVFARQLERIRSFARPIAPLLRLLVLAMYIAILWGGAELYGGFAAVACVEGYGRSRIRLETTNIALPKELILVVHSQGRYIVSERKTPGRHPAAIIVPDEQVLFAKAYWAGETDR